MSKQSRNLFIIAIAIAVALLIAGFVVLRMNFNNSASNQASLNAQQESIIRTQVYATMSAPAP